MQRGSVNRVMLVGHVGGAPDIRYTPSGTAVTNLSVATNEVYRDTEGNEQARTEWHRVVLWGKQAEFANNYIKKGRLVYIEGRLQTRTWEDRNNIERRTTEVVANAITPLGPATPGEEVEQEEEAASVSEEPPEDDDIPF
jgi:single-strand DNA-binding protein